MDYGKLAYIKAEEMESRLASLFSSTQTGSAVYSASPLFDFTTGEYYLTSTTGNGKVTLFCTATLRGDGETTGKLELKINGLTLVEKEVSLSTGESKEFTLIGIVNLYSPSSVSLASNANATLTRTQILVSGNGVKASISGANASVDKSNGGKWAIADSKDNNVCVRLFSEETGEFSEDYYFGAGSSVSLCKGASGFVLGFCDERANAFVVFLSEELQEQKRLPLTMGAEKIAVGNTEDGYICAVIKEGGVECFIFDDDTLCSMEIEVERPSLATSIDFVKNSSEPTLVITTPEQSYIKVVAKENKILDAVILNCVVSIPVSA